MIDIGLTLSVSALAILGVQPEADMFLAKIAQPFVRAAALIGRAWPYSGFLLGAFWLLLGYAVDPDIVFFPPLDHCPESLQPIVGAPIMALFFFIMFGIPMGIIVIGVSAVFFCRQLILHLPTRVRPVATGLIVSLFLAAFMWRAHAAPRSFCGHTVRWFAGESGVMQDANDLAEDLRMLPRFAPLQPWAIDTLVHYRNEQTLTNSSASDSRFLMSKSEVPEFLSNALNGTNSTRNVAPSVSIHLSADHQLDYVSIEWGCYHIAVGTEDFAPPARYTNQLAKAKSGIYVSAWER